jgi:hypothetical protein
MNVDYTEKLSKAINLMRKNIYNTKEFRQTFFDNLISSINASYFLMNSESYGGLSISVNIDINKFGNIESSKLVHPVAESLVLAITSVPYDGEDKYDIKEYLDNVDIVNNLANIVITGQNSILIKI